MQLQTEQVLLTHLLALSQDENAAYQARAIAKATITDIRNYLEREQKRTRDENYKAHIAFALARIEKPENIKPTKMLDLPPGAPIGQDLISGCE